jgi:hypothetical protein
VYELVTEGMGHWNPNDKFTNKSRMSEWINEPVKENIK